MTTFYRKVGRKYIPVHGYNLEYLDSFPQGAHLVMCYPGGQSRKFNIDPAYAPMIAAGRIAQDAISEALMKASDLRPKSNPITKEQQAAWDHLVELLGEDARLLEWPSAKEVAEKAVEAMQKEAMKLLETPSVKIAYDHFMMMCKLSSK